MHPELEHRLGDPAFWQALQPTLHISPQPLAGPCPALPAEGAEADDCQKSLRLDGYFKAGPRLDRSHALRLAQVVSDLARRGIPGVFAFVYDEFWQVLHDLRGLVNRLMGPGWTVAPHDVWIFHVPVGPRHAGWAPHRDLRDPRTLNDDGSPRALSVWIPLTDATPDNGCMNVLPTRDDPWLQGGNGDAAMLQAVRALPAEAGAVLGWNTHALHWGGRSSRRATAPRIAFGAYVQAAGFRLSDCEDDRHASDEASRPMTMEASLHLPFDKRLRAIGHAIQSYAGRFDISYRDLIDHLRAQPLPPGAWAARRLEAQALQRAPKLGPEDRRTSGP